MKFTKMHGLGNDYLYVYGEAPENVTELSRILSERHLGAGSDGDRLRMRVWERGSGVTLACGTGACASAMAAIFANYCHYDETIFVELDGGILKIQIAVDNTIFMTGPAETIYEGETDIC